MRKNALQSLWPLYLFILIFVGSGVLFTLIDYGCGFYELSPNVAIIPSLVLSFYLATGSLRNRLLPFLDGLRDKNIALMGVIYCLAGIFSSFSAAIGGVEAAVQLGINIIPAWFLLPGLFIVSAIIATSLGTSMGVIAALSPVAVNFATKLDLSSSWCLGAIISGAMFGDNLSLISDTTIAALKTQGARLFDKILMNGKIALAAMILTTVSFMTVTVNPGTLVDQSVDYVTLIPYAVILIAGFSGLNVILTLNLGISSALLLYLHQNANPDLVAIMQIGFNGVLSMSEILILSFLIGALSASISAQGGFDAALQKLKNFLNHFTHRISTHKLGQISISLLASVADIFTANNTVAIILSGPLVKKLARSYDISPARAATLVDTFSCVFQGILPYSAQILLASSIAGISPVLLVTKVIYCPLLGIVTLIWIFNSKPEIDHRRFDQDGNLKQLS